MREMEIDVISWQVISSINFWNNLKYSEHMRDNISELRESVYLYLIVSQIDKLYTCFVTSVLLHLLLSNVLKLYNRIGNAICLSVNNL